MPRRNRCWKQLTYQIIGAFYAVLVERRIVVETKAGTTLVEADWRQLINYLRGTHLEVGLLLHYGQNSAYKRVVFSNARKTENAERS